MCSSDSDYAYVIFEDDEGHWWSRFLHPKIRHCHVIIPHGDKWIVMGKSTKGTEVFLCNDLDITGAVVLKVCRRRSIGVFYLNTCVGFAKYILGINNPFILTPYQLMRYLL